MSETYLSHHGILGMKWGVRRFQNADGTRTAAGKKREASNKDTLKKAARTGASAFGIGATVAAGVASAAGTVMGAKKGSDDLFKAGKDGKPSQAEKMAKSSVDVANESNKLVTSVYKATSDKKDVSTMSDSELQAKINRMRLEQQYSDLEASKVSSGQQSVRSALEIAGSVAAIGASAATIAATIYRIKKGT